MGRDFDRTSPGYDVTAVSTRHVHCKWGVEKIAGQSGSGRVVLDA